MDDGAFCKFHLNCNYLYRPILKRNRIISVLKRLLGKKEYIEWRNAWLFGRNDDPVMLQELPELVLKWPPASENPAGPVIIISPTQRSGSNYAHELIALHPDLVAAGGRNGLPEEFFFHTYGTALKAYVEKTVPTWSTWIGDQEKLEEAGHRLFASLGHGILSGLETGVSADKLLMRAPDSRGIKSIYHLFPGARVILLFRDGRDTCASFLNSWGSKSVFEQFAYRWTGRAGEMLEFEKLVSNSAYEKQCMRIRYEECVNDPDAVIRKILPFLGLSTEKYPFESLQKVPLLGTSESDHVHWRPEPRPDGFNPLGRWKEWPEDEKNTFHQIAGDVLKELGYI